MPSTAGSVSCSPERTSTARLRHWLSDAHAESLSRLYRELRLELG